MVESRSWNLGALAHLSSLTTTEIHKPTTVNENYRHWILEPISLGHIHYLVLGPQVPAHDHTPFTSPHALKDRTTYLMGS